jgi:hypothetical protein
MRATPARDNSRHLLSDTSTSLVLYTGNSPVDAATADRFAAAMTLNGIRHRTSAGRPFRGG